MKIHNRINSNKNIDETSNSSDNSCILTINDLSKQERESYEIKKNLINLEGFVNMRILTKEALLVNELTSRSYSPEEINKTLESLNNIKEDRNLIINKLLMSTILLPKIEKTYSELNAKGGNPETKETLNKCYENGLNFINKHIKSSMCEDFNLRKCSKVARGELFLFVTNENKDKYMVLEVQKTNKDMGIDILDNQDFFVRIHFDENIDITKMSDILLKGKKFLNFYFTDKKIRYVIVSSWLFDDEFNEFWMKERIREGKKEIPNRIKIREESLNYGGKLASEKPSPDDPIEENFIQGEENSMTKAIKKYLSEGHILKEGGGYFDLEALEKWKSKQ